MKVLVLVILSPVVLLGIACLGMLIVKEAEISRNSNLTWAEADGLGLFDSGWLPEFIPETAHDISETHDIDTNMSCSSFRLNQAALPALVARLEASGFVQVDDSALTEQISPLSECPYSDPPAGADYLIQTIADSSRAYYAAVVQRDGSVYYWSSYR